MPKQKCAACDAVIVSIRESEFDIYVVYFWIGPSAAECDEQNGLFS